jgi:hypothetical protein
MGVPALPDRATGQGEEIERRRPWKVGVPARPVAPLQSDQPVAQGGDD